MESTNEEHKKIIICKVNNSKEYYSLCEILRDGNWIFRGHAESKWKLTSSLHRVLEDKYAFLSEKEKDPKLNESDNFNPAIAKIRKWNIPINIQDNEFYALKMYKKLSHHNYNENEMIKLLCDIQHFEGKTRLLDFSYSINVALFFAFENLYSTKERCIWAINYSQMLNNLLLPLILFCRYKIPEEDSYKEEYMKLLSLSPNNTDSSIEKRKNEILGEWEQYFKKSKYKDITNNLFFYVHGKEVKDDILYYVNQYIEKQEEKIYDDILPIEMPGVNPRIDAQNGLFLFSTRFKPINDALCGCFNINKNNFTNIEENKEEEIENDIIFDKNFIKNEDVIRQASIIKIIFDYKFSDESRKILQQSNITSRNIYPDETGLAKSIEYWDD